MIIFDWYVRLQMIIVTIDYVANCFLITEWNIWCGELFLDE